MLMNQVSEIEGVKITPINSLFDTRGTFAKFHPLNELKTSLDSVAISLNPILGTIRGLHFQLEPFAEEKLVTCIQGSVFDVAVDLRSESKTFGKWASIQLSAANSLQAYLPKGVAHGFQTTMPNSILHYCLSSPYSSVSSIAIDAFGDLGIQWPIKEISISERDSRGVTFAYAANQYAESLIKI
jgi:dTDP-4-dehydrorhamnose 3,5-epimerase